MAVVFREGHCSLSGKIMRTIFHSIKLLHLAQLAAHTKVKERDLLLYDREEWCLRMREQARQADTERASLHKLPLKLESFLLQYHCMNVGVSGLYFSTESFRSLLKGLSFIRSVFR